MCWIWLSKGKFLTAHIAAEYSILDSTNVLNRWENTFIGSPPAALDLAIRTPKALLHDHNIIRVDSVLSRNSLIQKPRYL